METIAIMTMAFLPATFFAVLVYHPVLTLGSKECNSGELLGVLGVHSTFHRGAVLNLAHHQ
jgi:hypothetical protein